MCASRHKNTPSGGSKKPAMASANEREHGVPLTNPIVGNYPLAPTKKSMQNSPEEKHAMKRRKKKKDCLKPTVTVVDEGTSGECSESSGTEPNIAEANTIAACGTDGAETPSAAGQSAATSSGALSTPSTEGNWTLSEDGMILGMKEDNATWDDIANAIGRGRSEVKKRYHELKVEKANEAAGVGKRKMDRVIRVPVDKDKAKKKAELVCAPPSEVTTESGSESDGGSGTNGGASISSGDLPGKSSKRVSFTDSDEGSESGEDEDDEDEEEDEYYDADDDEEEDEEEDDKTEEEKQDNFSFSFSYSSSSSEDEDGYGYDADDYDPYGPMDPIAWERERRRQHRFIERYLWASLYRNNASSSHQGFSKRDRAILASLRDRAVANRYLEMQANFFNATGRMVPLHLIQAKLEGRRIQTEEEHMLPRVARFQARVAKWNSGVASGDELLDPSVASEVPADALRATETDE